MPDASVLYTVVPSKAGYPSHLASYKLEVPSVSDSMDDRLDIYPDCTRPAINFANSRDTRG